MIKRKAKGFIPKTKINFSKNFVDVISTVSDQVKPTYGVQIAGKGLKGVFDAKSSHDDLHKDDLNQSKLSTIVDPETGNMTIKAQPYIQNPRLDHITTRNDYIKNGIVLQNLKNMQKARQKPKGNVSQTGRGSRLSNDQKHNQSSMSQHSPTSK